MAGQATREILGFLDDINDNLDTVMKESSITMMEIANTSVNEGGKLPYDTGYLQNSIVGGGVDDLGVIGREGFKQGIRAAGKNEDLCMGWEADYAKYQELGTSKISPRAFARSAMAQWETIVAQEAGKLNV